MTGHLPSPSSRLCLCLPSLAPTRPQADAGEGLAECLAWLAECGAVVVAGSGAGAGDQLDCKASAGQLKLPEDKTAVAHGDANLAIDDFLKGFGA